MEYEVEVEVDGHDYVVYADLYQEGSYGWTKDGAGQEWLDVETDPEFHNFEVYRYNDDNELVQLTGYWDMKVRKKAEDIMVQIYWNRIR